MNSCGNPVARWRRVQRAGRMSGPFVRFAPNAVECGDTAAVDSQTVPHSSLQGPMASAAVSDEGALRMRPTPCRCTSTALFSGIHRNCLFCGNTASVPPAARPHKLQATLRSAYVRLSQSRGAKLALLEPHAIPRPAASGRSRPFRCSSSPNCKRFAGLQFGSICLARKSRQKEALEPRYIAR